jgi:hypothetical protein
MLMTLPLRLVLPFMVAQTVRTQDVLMLIGMHDMHG